MEDYTPLHIAASVCNVKVLRLLLEAGGNLHLRDKEGRIPLDIAKIGDISLLGDSYDEPIEEPYRSETIAFLTEASARP